MKRFVLAGFATLALSSAGMPATQANPVSYRPDVVRQNTANWIAPDTIVTMAQRGQLKAQGISGGLQFTSDYVFGRVTAQTLVQRAVEAGMLPESAKRDRGYVHAVESALDTHLRLN